MASDWLCGLGPGPLMDLPVQPVDRLLQDIHQRQAVLDDFTGSGEQLQRGEPLAARAASAALRAAMTVIGQDRVDPVAQQRPQPHQLRPVPQQRPQLAHLDRGDPRLRQHIRNAAYDLRKLRGKHLADKPGRTRRYFISPGAARIISALLTLREQVIAPLLAGVADPRIRRTPRHWTDIDRHYQALRLEIMALFADLGIACG